jgi:hypothetical protein
MKLLKAERDLLPLQIYLMALAASVANFPRHKLAAAAVVTLGFLAYEAAASITFRKGK